MSAILYTQNGMNKMVSFNKNDHASLGEIYLQAVFSRRKTAFAAVSFSSNVSQITKIRLVSGGFSTSGKTKKPLKIKDFFGKLEKRLELSTPSLREKKSEFFTIQYFAKSPVLWDLFVLFRLRFL